MFSGMPRKGRPKREEKIVKVWLRQSIFRLWKEKKEQLGFSKKTNSQFAEYLLCRCDSSEGAPSGPPSGKSNETIQKSKFPSFIAFSNELFTISC